MKLQELFKSKEEINGKIKELKEEIKNLDALINEQVQEEFTKSRNKKDKHFGAMSLNIEGLDVKQTVGKTIVWDQNALCNLYRQIDASGEDVNDYMKVKFEVPEKIYSKLTEDKLKFFEPARTEKQGTVKIEVVEKKK